MMSEAKCKAKQNEIKGTGLKILSPKQMLQRLPIALAQVKQAITQKDYQVKSGKLFFLCINQNKSQKSIK